MNIYSKEEKLVITKLIGVTQNVYDILRQEKRNQKISMAKIICNLIINKYCNENTYDKKKIQQ